MIENAVSGLHTKRLRICSFSDLESMVTGRHWRRHSFETPLIVVKSALSMELYTIMRCEVFGC